MKKLLVLAVLGLGLGGGVWKLQNPQGTVEDLRSQAQAVASRLKGGVQAGVQAVRETSPATVDAARQEQEALISRLADIETNQADQQQINARLATIEASLSEQQSLFQRIGDLEASANEAAAPSTSASLVSDQLADLSGIISGVDTRLDAADQRLGAQEEALSAVSTALEELDRKIATVSASVVEVDESVAEVTAGNDAGIVRLDAIDSRLELLVRRLDEQTMNSELQALSENVEGIKSQLTQLDQNYATLDESSSSDLAAVSERADALTLRLNTLASSNQSSVNESTDESTSAAANGAANGASTVDPTALVSAFNSDLDERFSAIESRLETVNSDSRRISALTEQLEAARNKITQLEARDASTIQTVGEINESIAELKTASESLSIETVQTEVRDQLALVQSQLESNIAANNTDALEELLNSTRSQIQLLEKRVQELPASSSEADNAQQIQSALESQIASLERRLETTSSADPALVNTLTNVQEQVDQLAAKGFVTQDELRAQKEGKSVEYKIYFDRNSAEVTEDAAKVLNSFIAQEKNRTTGVSIFGFTDRRGSAIYNQQLALQRATNVRSFLIQNGLDYTKIKALSGLGEDAAAAVLPDNADDAQQRVVVLYAAQK